MGISPANGLVFQQMGIISEIFNGEIPFVGIISEIFNGVPNKWGFTLGRDWRNCLVNSIVDGDIMGYIMIYIYIYPQTNWDLRQLFFKGM